MSSQDRQLQLQLLLPKPPMAALRQQKKFDPLCAGYLMALHNDAGLMQTPL